MSIVGSIIVPHPPLILPQIGEGQERAIQKTIDGYREAMKELALWQPETVVILSPHTARYEDYFHISPGIGIQRTAEQFRHFEARYRQVQMEKWEQRKAKEDPYIQLARFSLEYYVKYHQQAPLPSNLPADMTNRQAGAFVSLKIAGQLRGCIGTIGAVQPNLAQEILHNAVSAGMEDPRFPPVQESELMDLVYSVDVLEEAEPVASLEELDAAAYGVIVTCKGRQGLLLPNLEGVDSVEQQVAIALRKAGIEEQEPYQIERCQVKRHI